MQEYKKKLHGSAEQLRGPRIAILSRALFSYHSKVLWGFLKQVESQTWLRWRPILFFCKEPNTEVMREQMHEIKEDNYDLVISIGALYSQIAMEHIRNNTLSMPLIFSGVTDPVEMNMLSSLSPEHLITGVVREQISSTYLADFLFFIKPSMRRVLIPHYPGSEFGFALEKLQLLQTRFVSLGVDVILMPVNAMNEVLPFVQQYVGCVDTIIIPEGAFVADLTPALSRLCKKYKITLVGHNTEPIGDNPAIIFTQRTESIGEAVFSLAKQILVDKVAPHDIPIVSLPNDRKIIVDVNACVEQGVDIDAITLFCGHNNIIVKE